MANAHGFRHRAAAASVLRGWALAAGGRPEQGIEILRDGLAGCRKTGAEMDRPYYLALLAEACWNAGRWEDGLHAVNEGLIIVRESRDSLPFFYEAELHRLKACLLLRRWVRDRGRSALATSPGCREAVAEQLARATRNRGVGASPTERP
jgi:predicted ATPase